MKKLLTSMTSILLIIMMLLGMVACGGEGSGAPGNTAATDAEIILFGKHEFSFSPILCCCPVWRC